MAIGVRIRGAGVLALALLAGSMIEARKPANRATGQAGCLDEVAVRAAALGVAGLPGAIRPAALETALAKVQRFGCPTRGRSVILVVDFTLPSSQPRLWLVDLKTGGGLGEPLFVAHGKGSDPDDDGIAQAFSNIQDSLMSSLGAFRGAESYWGKRGLSLKIDGLEPTNNRARARNIVLHTSAREPPDYVSPGYLAENGRLGLSDGCFVVMQSDFSRLRRTLERGGLLIAVGPETGPPLPQ